MSIADPAVPAVPAARAADAPAGDRPFGLSARIGAEAAGAFMLVFAGFGVSLFNGAGGVTPAMAFGLALAAAMLAFGYISGGHFNPAITLGAALAGRTGWKNVLPYIVAQLLGASAAAGLFLLLISGHPQDLAADQFFASIANGYGEHSPAQFALTGVLLAEVFGTALLVAAFLGATAKRANKVLVPFAVGFTYLVLLTTLQPIGGGGLNPARSLAAAYFAEPWAFQQLWLFWVAPLVGAVLAGAIFRAAETPLRAATAIAAPADEDDEDDFEDGDDLADLGDKDGALPQAAAPKEDAKSFFERDAKDEPGNR